MNQCERRIVDAFHDLYYTGPQGSGYTHLSTYWMGVLCQKCPLDLWVYQEIIFEVRPDLIVETGTHSGGSTLFLAHLCDLLGNGSVVSIDIEPRPRPAHPRIRYVLGSSGDSSIIDEALGAYKHDAQKNIMVILDSDHSEQHVLRELELLAPHVRVGGYLIIEDTNINGHPTYPNFGPGPFEAVEKFLANNKQFVIDYSREKFLMTFNPRGYLKRIG
jgi:cephalosporin hydroxylase